MKDEFKINVIKNKSTTYMLPFVDSELNLEFKYKMLNSYLSFSDGDDIFCILYDWCSDVDFLRFEGNLMENNMFIGHEDYGEKCLYKFRLNNKMLIARDAFIEARHSDFSISHKSYIENYLKENNASNIVNIMSILDPNRLRTSDKPDMDKETFLNNLTIIKTKPDKLYESN